MKRIILSLAICAMLVPTAVMAQEEKVELESFERCNNWARHYCQGGLHEEAVNRELLRLKTMGIPITLKRIKMLAQRMKPDTPRPTQEQAQQ